jgi:pimeloyl-ACP methyl ester carboxylesterase
MSELFVGFAEQTIKGDGADIFVRTGGSGNPLLLIHGFPQTGAMWHKIAQQLAEHFFVVIPDIRGYGRSSKPANTADNVAYSKRAMANDLIAVMERLGHGRFAVAGHDRGGRVAYRMALDHHAQVETLVTLDIVPTVEQWNMLARVDGAVDSYHWPFLARPHPFPERMIEANADYYLDTTLASWTAGNTLDAFSTSALDDYRTYFGMETSCMPCATTTGPVPLATSSMTGRPLDEGPQDHRTDAGHVGRDGFWQESRLQPARCLEALGHKRVRCCHQLRPLHGRGGPGRNTGAMLPFLQGLHA